MSLKLYRPLSEPEKKDLNDIIDMVADYFGIERNILFRKDRISRYVFARAVYFIFASNNTEIPGYMIAWFINKHHSSGSYYKNLPNKDNSFKNILTDFQTKNEHMRSIKDLINSKYKNYEELKEKFLFLENLINTHFKNVKFRNVHLSMLRYQITDFRLSKYDESMIILYDFAHSFIDEYIPIEEAEQYKLNFESKGRT